MDWLHMARSTTRQTTARTTKTPPSRQAKESVPAKSNEFAPSPHDTPQERREIGSALGRAVDMLETILDTDGALGMQELCTRLDLPRQSAHRILNQLLDLRLLQRSVGRVQFTIGPRLRALALKASYQSQRTGPWHSVLQDLAERTGETCNIGILDQNKVLLIDRIESEYALRVHSEVGRRLDPHASAIGKLLLAYLSKGRRRQLLEQEQPLKRFTSHTLVDIKDLEAEFTTIRRQGYSVSNQGTTLGMLSLAAPVRDSQGRVVAGIACQAPFVRLTYDRAIEEIVPLLLQSAERMQQTLIEDEAD